MTKSSGNVRQRSGSNWEQCTWNVVDVSAIGRLDIVCMSVLPVGQNGILQHYALCLGKYEDGCHGVRFYLSDSLRNHYDKKFNWPMENKTVLTQAIGNAEQVLREKMFAKLQLDEIEVLNGRHNMKVVEYPELDAGKCDVIMKRVASVLEVAHYSMFACNCETYASWCKFGVGRSLQAEKILALLAASTERSDVPVVWKNKVWWFRVFGLGSWAPVAATIASGEFTLVPACTINVLAQAKLEELENGYDYSGKAVL